MKKKADSLGHQIDGLVAASEYGGSLFRFGETATLELLSAMASVCRSGDKIPEPRRATSGVVFRVDLWTLEVLGGAAHRYWHSDGTYDWRAAEGAAWETHVASCSRCRRKILAGNWNALKNGICPYGCDSAVRRI